MVFGHWEDVSVHVALWFPLDQGITVYICHKFPVWADHSEKSCFFSFLCAQQNRKNRFSKFDFKMIFYCSCSFKWDIEPHSYCIYLFIFFYEHSPFRRQILKRQVHHAQVSSLFFFYSQKNVQIIGDLKEEGQTGKYEGPSGTLFTIILNLCN